MAPRGILFVVVLVGSVVAVPFAARSCSWSSPIWVKDRRSDTPLFRFVTGGRAGYIDAKGRIVIPPQFPVYWEDPRDDFYEGVAGVGFMKSIAIDRQGRRIPALAKRHLGDNHVSEGLIRVAMGKYPDYAYGFLDIRGRVAIPAQFEAAGFFSEGVAPVKTGGRWGYVDRSGRFAIAPVFLYAAEFADGAARVVTDGPCRLRGHGPCADLSTTPLGAEALSHEASQTLPECRSAFIDHRGDLLFAQAFEDAYDYSEGLAAVRAGSRWGFIDKTGTARIAPRFDRVSSFSGGLARFASDSRPYGQGFLDRTGRVVIPPRYPNADDFSEGLAAVGTMGERMWYIDRAGKKAIADEFARAGGFRFGLAPVCTGADCAYIDRTGRRVFRFVDRR